MFGKKDKQQNENGSKKTKECSIPVLVFLIIVGLLFIFFSNYFFCPIHTFLTMIIEFLFFFVGLPAALIYTGINRKRFLEDEKKSKKTAAILGAATFGTLLLFLKTGTVLLGDPWELPSMFEDVTIRWGYPSMKENVRIITPKDEDESEDEETPQGREGGHMCTKGMMGAAYQAGMCGRNPNPGKYSPLCAVERGDLFAIKECRYREVPGENAYDFYLLANTDVSDHYWCDKYTDALTNEPLVQYLRDPSIRVRVHKKTYEILEVETIDWSDTPCAYDQPELEGLSESQPTPPGCVYTDSGAMGAWVSDKNFKSVPKK